MQTCYSLCVKTSSKVSIPEHGRPATSSIRFRPEDWTLIETLQEKTGVSSVTDLIRMALRSLATKEGVR